MSLVLKIKRSDTNPTAIPSGLAQGELAYAEGTSLYTDAQQNSVTSYGKLYIGRGAETLGFAEHIDVIGGKYFTDLLDHEHGTLLSNSSVIVDSLKKINEWNVDNIRLDGNTISSTDNNGNLTLSANGTGLIQLSNSVDIFGNQLLSSSSTFDLLSSGTQTVNFASSANQVNIGSSTTQVDFGDIKVLGTKIYSTNSNQTITIDPYPAGGSGQGELIVRGNLQVTGTTTTVNSTQLTINDPVVTLGDGVSEKLISVDILSGSSTIFLDNVEGLNVGDSIDTTGIPPQTNITAIDSQSNSIIISNPTTSDISSGSFATITQGADDSKDRGVEFFYYKDELKTGFFGYDSSGILEDQLNFYFTYIPESSNSGQIFSGTVGSAYFNTVKLEVGQNKGIAFFDEYKRLTTTVAGSSDIETSNQMLTVDSFGTPSWTTTIDGGSY